MDKSLNQNLTLEGIHNLNCSVICRSEFVGERLLTKKTTGQHSLTINFHQTFKEEIIPISRKIENK